MHIEKDSPLLNVHPAIKVVALFSINIIAWILESPFFLLLFFIILISSYKIFSISTGRIRRFIIFTVLIAQAVTISYLLGSKIPGEFVYISFPWGTYISEMTLLYASTMILRFTCMLIGSTLILAVIRDVDIVYGLLTFRIPYVIAFMFNLALRFSSVFLDDFSKIRDAMILRGANIDSGGLLRRARYYTLMGIPLTVLALRRMNELSYILEIKGLSVGEERSYFYEFRVDSKTFITIAFLIGMPIIILLLRVFTNIVSFPGWPLI